MKVLLTNHELALRGGSQLYLRDVARGLLDLGHQPIAYSPRLGDTAEEIRAEGVPVVDDLDRVREQPDVVHGQHNLPTMTALLHFPEVPAVFFCHGWLPWEEAPPRFPRILRYVAVDRLRRERMVSETGIEPERVELVPNFVDLRRIDRRQEPLPERPRRALLFSNQANLEWGFGKAVREACTRQGIDFDTLGFAAGNPSARPGRLLHHYDLVFARGRSAMEAMAAGAVVVLCDDEGLGPLVDGANVEALAGLNFGLGALREPVTADRVALRIRRYAPRHAAATADWVARHRGLEQAMGRVVEVYRRVIEEWQAAPRPDAGAERAAVADYLSFLSRRRTEEQRMLDALHVRAGELSRDLEEERTRGRDLRGEKAAVEERAAALHRELADLEASRAVRARRWLGTRPALARLYRLLSGARSTDS